jgi:probable HAF family extracellular repeat protein
MGGNMVASKSLLLKSLCLILGAFTPFVGADVRYSVQDIGTLGGAGSAAFAINASGAVAGSAFNTAGIDDAVIYDHGSLIDLGTQGGSSALMTGINSAGDAIGNSYHNGTYVPFSYSGGQTQNLNLPNTTFSVANAINDAGQITGLTTTTSGSTVAYLYANGAATYLPTFGGRTSGNGLNKYGQVVGASGLDSSINATTHAFLYSDGQMTDLGTLQGYASSAAEGINDDGNIVGDVESSAGVTHAMLYEGGAMSDLDSLAGTGSVAFAINNSQVVVGRITYATGLNHAFVYSDGTMLDLNTLIAPNAGWILESASGINGNGQIVGFGTLDGEQRGFVLTPAPEPVTLSLLAFAPLILLRRKTSGRGR